MYSDSELLELLRDAETEIIPLTSDAFDKHDAYPTKSTVSRRFGGWGAACEKAGVESGQVTSVSIRHNIERLYEAGEINNSEDFFQHDETTSAATFYTNFDSWRDAVDEIGIAAYDEYTDQDILNYIKQFYDEYGYISQKKFKYDDSYPSSSTAARRFGSWNEAVKGAGIEPNKMGVAAQEQPTGETQALLGSNWHKQREAALDRDGFQCRSCQATTNLHVHHTKPRHTYRSSTVFDIDESNTLDNLVTLCEDCHYNAHSGEPTPANEQTTLAPRIV
jgi:hypothetical protein